MTKKIKAALLVDADNLPIAQAEEALEKLAEICNPVIKKAFGDFTKSAKNWSPEFMRKHGFTPEMHFAVSNFKNGADIAMCIAAMDIVHAKTVEAIVLFTSDSDFASLAARIREAGLEVVGVGDTKASAVLQSAFDTFVVVEAKVGTALKLVKAPSTQTKDTTKPNKSSKKELVPRVLKEPTKTNNNQPRLIPSNIRSEIRLAVENLSDGEIEPLPATVYATVNENHPRFSFEHFNYSSLSELLRAINAMEIEDKLKGIAADLQKPAPKSANKPSVPKATAKQKAIPATIRKLIVQEVKAAEQEGVQAMVSRINNKVKAEIPNFSHNTYGFAKVSSLLNSMSEVVLVNGNKAVELSKK